MHKKRGTTLVNPLYISSRYLFNDGLSHALYNGSYIGQMLVG